MKIQIKMVFFSLVLFSGMAFGETCDTGAGWKKSIEPIADQSNFISNPSTVTKDPYGLFGAKKLRLRVSEATLVSLYKSPVIHLKLTLSYQQGQGKSKNLTSQELIVSKTWDNKEKCSNELDFSNMDGTLMNGKIEISGDNDATGIAFKVYIDSYEPK